MNIYSLTVKPVSATDAKNNFGAVIESALHSPVEITRNGASVAVVMSAKLFKEVQGIAAFCDVKKRLTNREVDVMTCLRRLSSGELRMSDALDWLRLEDPGQVLDLLGIADLPIPTVDDESLEAMVKTIHEVFSHG